ncbi:EAL and modified HD-GYP domain-containing signal transduction protein [Duganella sacchari]|uniref:EAL and modified HD-GYP domain-containing signal transduction protein n=1 Tax=Duganella sacchari TaxID=551987 RepID=A0A1M7N5N7_9BURK|nr:HDOD domain-containing protein [Duganella sacchari]SHM98896.1 EAL and modified HD-GYP domain-containing signal transduction protein [Duganella sacchari]
MGFLSFLRSKPEPQKQAASAPATPPPAAPAPRPVEDAGAMVTRAEIVDERHRLCGYRFSAPQLEPALIDTMVAAHVPQFAQNRMALVQLSMDAVVFNRHLPLIAPHTVFLLDRKAANLPADQIAGRMAALRESGCKVALRGVTLDVEDAPLLAACDIVVLYLNEHTLAEFQTLTKQLRLRYQELKLIVDGVESWDEQRMCASWGCNYFMGHFLTTSDKVDPDAKIDQSRMTSIELLNLLRTDAELPAMIEVAKRDPGMTYQVLQWANAPSNGQATKVTSLQQAFMVLGRNQLYRGLTVSMFRLGGGATKERDESLLEVALTRARFLETCSRLPQTKRDELFLVGLLSLFDVLLGVPMANLVSKMHLSDDIRDVLLHSAGAYGPYLMMVLLLERDKVDRALEIAAKLEVEMEALPSVGQAAFQWAQESMHHTSADD